MEPFEAEGNLTACQISPDGAPFPILSMDTTFPEEGGFGLA
jgi:hypothetical protein